MSQQDSSELLGFDDKLIQASSSEIGSNMLMQLKLHALLSDYAHDTLANHL